MDSPVRACDSLLTLDCARSRRTVYLVWRADKNPERSGGAPERYFSVRSASPCTVATDQSVGLARLSERQLWCAALGHPHGGNDACSPAKPIVARRRIEQGGRNADVNAPTLQRAEAGRIVAAR
jgi:hypothetical protein